MGLLEQEIQELRTMIKHYDAGKISDDTVRTKIAIYSQTEKRAKLMLNAFGLYARRGKASLNRIMRSNLIGDGTAIEIDLIEIEEEKIKCPDQDFKLITRGDCLDYSGDHPSCLSCENDKVTKRMLIKTDEIKRF